MKISTCFKSVIALVLVVVMASSAKAQIATENAKLLDNTYVTVNVGAATPLNALFSDMFPVNPLGGIAVGKWFTPCVGAELEATGWFGSHIGYTKSNFGTNKIGGHNAVRGVYGGINGLVNLTNAFAGYQGSPRFFEIISVVGIGWAHGFRPHMADGYNNYWAGKTGLDFAFNLGKEKTHTVSLRPAVLWNLTTPGAGKGSSAFNVNGAQLYIGAAYTYHFKTSNGTRHFKTYDIGAMNDQIDSLRQELAKKPKEVVREVVKTVEVPAKNQGEASAVQANSYVFFAQNSAELTSEAKSVLDNVEGTVDIVATSSPEGSASYNQALSERRAAAVSNYLKSKGVTVNSCKGTGVKNETSARVAIIKVK
ncbi:MAG: OmpA family protein [Prevotella sp.]|nr:OmpA family protein [Prevotella sp.]